MIGCRGAGRFRTPSRAASRGPVRTPSRAARRDPQVRGTWPDLVVELERDPHESVETRSVELSRAPVSGREPSIPRDIRKIQRLRLLGVPLAVVLLAGTAGSVSARSLTPSPIPRNTVIRGTLELEVADAFASDRDVEQSWLRTSDGRRVDLVLPSSALPAPGTRVRVAGGLQSDGSLLVAPGGLRVTATTGARASLAAASADSGIQPMRIAVLLFTLPDARNLGISVADARAVYFTGTPSVAQFYTEVSNGQSAITGDVLGPFQLNGIADQDCQVDDWAAAARAAATASGVDLSTYTNIAYSFPYVASCPWGGMAEVSGVNSYINGLSTGNVGVYTAAHELGHNLGSGHAHTSRCTLDGTAVTIAPDEDCTLDEYGDPFSVMGSGFVRHPDAWERSQEGFFGSDQRQVVQVLASGRYRIPVLEAAGSAGRLFRIHRADGSFLDLEYHQPYGSFDDFGSGSPVVLGVTVRLVGTGPNAQTLLLDATPQTDTFDDAALAPGHSISDPYGGVTVSVVSADATGATIDVPVVDMSRAPGSGPDVTPPLPAVDLSATRDAGGAVRLRWQPSLDDVGVTGYRVTRDGSLLGTTPDPWFSDSAATSDSAHDYAIEAFDAAGNLGQDATIRLVAPDTTPPSTPRGLTATALSETRVRIDWAAAVDDVGVVGYRIHRGSVTRSTTALSWTEIGLAAGHTYRFDVVAVDAAGNASAAGTVTVATLDTHAPGAPRSIKVTKGNATVRASWGAAVDNVGVVRYLVAIDGGRSRATTALYFSAPRPSAGNHTISVRAVDRAGNVGPARRVAFTL